MPKIILGTAALLLVGLAAPAIAQPYRDAAPDGVAPSQRHVDRDGPTDQLHHRPGVAKAKSRVCFRPDVGRYSRLIPYAC